MSVEIVEYNAACGAWSVVFSCDQMKFTVDDPRSHNWKALKYTYTEGLCEYSTSFGGHSNNMGTLSLKNGYFVFAVATAGDENNCSVEIRVPAEVFENADWDAIIRRCEENYDSEGCILIAVEKNNESLRMRAHRT